MIKSYTQDWKLLGNAEAGLAYVYEYYDTTIPILDLNSGEFIYHLAFSDDTFDMVRIADLELNPETNLIYLANQGGPNHNLIVIDGNTEPGYSTIQYGHVKGTIGISKIGINSNTNTLYGVTADEKLIVIDLDTESITELDLIPESALVVDLKVNSKTNQIFVLSSDDDRKMYVIDGDTNNLVETLQFEKQPHRIEINEQINEIYLNSLHEGALQIISDNDYSQVKKIKFHNSKHLMTLDSINDKLYLSNPDKSITVIDLHDFNFDIVDNCSEPTGMFLDSINDKLYLSGDTGANYANKLTDDIQRPESVELWIEEFPYDRNEYLLNEEINFRIDYSGNQEFLVDSITIKNLNNNETVFAFSEFQLTPENNNKILAWNQLDKEGKKVISGDYALLIRGYDIDDDIHLSHKVFSIIETVQLDTLQSLFQNMFSYMDLSYINTIYSQNLEKTLSVKKQLDFGLLPKDVMCKKDMTLVIFDDIRSACVKPSTAEKLIERGLGY